VNDQRARSWSVITVQRFDADEQRSHSAMARAMAASVWTQNLARAHRFAIRSMQAVWVDDHTLFSPDVPQGGYGDSGYGKENGVLGAEELTRLKQVSVDLGTAKRITGSPRRVARRELCSGEFEASTAESTSHSNLREGATAASPQYLTERRRSPGRAFGAFVRCGNVETFPNQDQFAWGGNSHAIRLSWLPPKRALEVFNGDTTMHYAGGVIELTPT
jgi:hypothetical protein